MEPSGLTPTSMRRFEALPGWELVRAGLEDLRRAARPSRQRSWAS